MDKDKKIYNEKGDLVAGVPAGQTYSSKTTIIPFDKGSYGWCFSYPAELKGEELRYYLLNH